MKPYTLESGSFESVNGYCSIAWHLYLPLEEPKAIVQLSHGMCEYVNRYEPLAEYLTARGIIFCGNDHLGHGDSIRSERDLGFFGKQGWQSEVKNMYRFTLMLHERFPHLPIILLGHSMGSFLARAYLALCPDHLAAACLCGTSGALPTAPIGLILAHLIGKFKGQFYRSEFLQKLAFGKYNDRIVPRRSSFDWLSHSDEVVDRYIADPRCNFTFTANGFQNLLSVLHFASSKKAFDQTPSLPLLLICGSADPVGQYGKGVLQTATRYFHAGVFDLSCHIYPGERHEIFNEPEYELAFSDFYHFVSRFFY